PRRAVPADGQTPVRAAGVAEPREEPAVERARSREVLHVDDDVMDAPGVAVVGGRATTWIGHRPDVCHGTTPIGRAVTARKSAACERRRDRRFTFCTAVDENGRGFRNPAAALGCYRIKDAGGQPRFVRRDVAIDGEFGSETATVTRGCVLCVPSTAS